MVSYLGKLALKSAVNIPHMELCATVLGVEISMIFKEQPDIATKDFQCYKAVELYLVISKTRRHFYVYVRNRKEQIHRFVYQSTGITFHQNIIQLTMIRNWYTRSDKGKSVGLWTYVLEIWNSWKEILWHRRLLIWVWTCWYWKRPWDQTCNYIKENLSFEPVDLPSIRHGIV